MAQKKLTTIEQYAVEDKRLEHEADKRTFALMEHRWKAAQEFGVKPYAQATGRSKQVVWSYSRAWELVERDRADTSLTKDIRPASDYLALANASTEKQEALEAVADQNGISINQAMRAHGYEVAYVTRSTRAGREAAAEREAEALLDPDAVRPMTPEGAELHELEQDPAFHARVAAGHTERAQEGAERLARSEEARRTQDMALWKYIHVRLRDARLALQLATRTAHEAEEGLIDESMTAELGEEIELVRQHANLLAEAIGYGTAPGGTDWDAEFARLGEGLE